jgi:hypothetical protein
MGRSDWSIQATNTRNAIDLVESLGDAVDIKMSH